MLWLPAGWDESVYLINFR